jgi:hypothetical protein
MKKGLLVILILSLNLLAAHIFADSASYVKKYVKQEFYTAINMWATDGKILSTNYHVDTFIPAGSKVKVTDIYVSQIGGNDKSTFTFALAEDGRTFTFIYRTNFSVIPFKDVLARVFADKNVLAEPNDFTNLEKENIQAGTVAVGMSKKAVLVAYGYPPAHKTPKLEGNAWLYWTNRFNRVLVSFKDDKVIQVNY